MRNIVILTVAAFAAALPAAAFAQPAASPHQHSQSATSGHTPPAGQHKAPQDADGPCDCCRMMKEMMQMMHPHGSQPGAMQKMNMMQSPGSPQQGSAPSDAAQHQKHEEKPRN